jgi:glycosyltransferase involved in cell wall biosynthesis
LLTAIRLTRMVPNRPRVLVMFEQLPREAADFAGTFSFDYLAAIAQGCEVTVLMPGPGSSKGLVSSGCGADGVERLTWTPWLRGGGAHRQRLSRVEALFELGWLGNRLPKIDIIHAHGPVFHGAAALTLGRKLGVPVVLTVHTGPFSKLLRRASVRWMTRRTLEGVDCVCPVSHDLRRQIETAGIRTRRMEVTYNPVDTELFRPGPSDDGQPHRRMVFAGRLEEYKGALRVARAFAEIAERWPGWTLTIAGDGPERTAIERFVRTHPALSSRVHLLGVYTKPQLADLFATSDCFVYPSRHETFGLVLAEAMSAGLPVIGPDRTAPPEYIDPRCGLLVSPDDEAALAQAMDRLLCDLPTYSREVIRSSVVERFGLNVFGKRLLALYDDLLGAGRHAGRCAESRA